MLTLFLRFISVLDLALTELLTCDDVQCLNGANCTDEEGQFDCLCDFGYTGIYCESGRLQLIKSLTMLAWSSEFRDNILNNGPIYPGFDTGPCHFNLPGFVNALFIILQEFYRSSLIVLIITSFLKFK